MRDYGGAADNAVSYGTLHIELPCAYLILPDEPGADHPGERMMLRLPRAGTRYDTAAGTLWVRDDGPFRNGGYVEGGGGGGGSIAPPCDAAASWSTSAMKVIDTSRFDR